MNELGQLVKDHREALGLTQADLAHQAEVTVGTISAIERGETVPKVTTALAISRVLGVPVEGLFAPADSTEQVENTSHRPNSAPSPVVPALDDRTPTQTPVSNPRGLPGLRSASGEIDPAAETEEVA